MQDAPRERNGNLVKPVKKVVLAYSGGLDTSVILRWLKEKYQCEVVAWCADVGQAEELDGLEAKAKATGASQYVQMDLRETFVKDFVFPAFRANALYEGEYLLGTSLARPCIIQGMMQTVREVGAEPVLLVPLVDRGGTVVELVAAEGIPVRPLVTAPDLGFDYEG